MFDPIFHAVARALAGIYSLPVIGGSYGIAIFFLTLAVMVLLMPLTLKATRSTIKMQLVQPELKAIQKKHKGGDREAMNAEVMALYQREGINPVGGCVPMLLQAPVFIVMFRVIRGLTRRDNEVGYYELAQAALRQQSLPVGTGNNISPTYLDHSSKLYQDLHGSTKMAFGPFDLSLHPLDVLRDSIPSAIPYIVLILFVVAGSYYQQRQVTARRAQNTPAPTGVAAQQQAMLKFLPLLTGVWSFIFPTGLVLYWFYQSLFRIAQQGYITRSLYGHDGEGTLALQRAAAHAEEEKAASSAKPEKTEGKADKPKQQKTERAVAKESAQDDSATATSNDSREAFFERKRAAKKRATNQSASTSSRLTPKGTQSGPGNKKRKR
ncbi:MAG: YidC/Oxa1 family membrane protein insertase [Acidimicrobiales bacterium]